MKVALTGCSGYLAGQLIPHLLADDEISEVIGIDQALPRLLPPGMTFLKLDVRNPALGEHLARHKIDALVHLAFILNPMFDEAFMRAVNVDGTCNVLTSCLSARIKRVLVTSSASAYGASPLNVPFLPEETSLPQPGDVGFSYARHKIEQEGVCDQFTGELQIIRTRPSAVVGPNMDNFIQRLLLQKKMIAATGHNPEMQFLHERDLGRALFLLLKRARPGAYNVAPADAIKLYTVSEILGRPLKLLSPGMLSRLTGILWRFHRGIVPPEYLDFILHPWTISVNKINKEVGFVPEFSSIEALRSISLGEGELIRGPARYVNT